MPFDLEPEPTNVCANIATTLTLRRVEVRPWRAARATASPVFALPATTSWNDACPAASCRMRRVSAAKRHNRLGASDAGTKRNGRVDFSRDIGTKAAWDYSSERFPILVVAPPITVWVATGQIA